MFKTNRDKISYSHWDDFHERRDAAVELGKLGFYVFTMARPVGPGMCSCNAKCENIGNHPLTNNWEKESTTDEVDIRDMFTFRKAANIGVAIEKSGLVVIIINGSPEGIESLKSLKEMGDLGQPLKSITGGDEILLIYKSGSISFKSRKNILPGIDVRGQDDFFVVPPSLHASGYKNQWLTPPNTVELSELPEWFAKLILQHGNSASDTGNSGKISPLQTIMVVTEEVIKEDEPIIISADEILEDEPPKAYEEEPEIIHPGTSTSTSLVILRENKNKSFSIKDMCAPTPTLVFFPPAQKILTVVDVKRPDYENHFRVHPDPNYCTDALVLDFKKNGQQYLVYTSIAVELSKYSKVHTKRLFLTITQDGKVSIWPIKIQDDLNPKEWVDPWNKSGKTAAETAMKSWVRINANQAKKEYELFKATWDLEPNWPEDSFEDILEIAFKDRVISSSDHPVVKYFKSEFYVR